jgi:broad specificity phosphatase PhoE
MNSKSGRLEDITQATEESTKTEDSSSGHPKHFIILVRHGERCDDPEREIVGENDSAEPSVKFDCHLTDKGRRQAFQTGEYIKECVIEQNKLKIKSSDIKIFSSPFLRCIQTASEICEGLGYNIPGITLDDRFGEFLMKSWFDSVEKPLSHLTLNHIKHSSFQKKYLGREGRFKFTRFYGKDGIPTAADVKVAEEDKDNEMMVMESNSEIKYPETYSDMYYRYSGVVNQVIYQEFFENAEEIQDKSKIVIIVSHGFSFDPFIN